MKQRPIISCYTTVATAQVAAACVVSAIVCPFIVSFAFKMLNKNKMKKLENEANEVNEATA